VNNRNAEYFIGGCQEREIILAERQFHYDVIIMNRLEINTFQQDNIFKVSGSGYD
jgi:hypothetical protein